ncbi:5927_t:CDS:2 [Diversispora eburnea]|uniref:5927_t:CDS:1 n=1 Tax=Diversispora eburnea TaxID=1213867 RepID=A0A9N8VFZ7_9GLOM|nr:5927_t:CDS:2 [Diversispora eburnea]
MANKELYDDELNISNVKLNDNSNDEKSISLISLTPELLAEICENLSPEDLYILSTVCKKFREFLWSTSRYTQQIWRNSRLKFLCQLRNPFDKEIMSEQQYIWLNFLGNSCQFCGIEIKERIEHVIWEFKVLSCQDCLENKTSCKKDLLLKQYPKELLSCLPSTDNITKSKLPFIFEAEENYYLTDEVNAKLAEYTALKGIEKNSWLKNKKNETNKFKQFYVTGYTPFARLAHTSAIISEKLYICGGDIEGYSVSKISDFFYLDVSLNKIINYIFNNDTLSWNELSNLNIIYTSWGTAVAGGINNTAFILFGGHMSPDNNSLVLSFDTIKNTWSRPNITGNQPIRRRNTQAVINNSNGAMYIFGGSADPFTDYPSLKFFNDMIILDTILWTWKFGSIFNAPSPRQGFSATMLPGGIIAYIGGTIENLTMVSMSEINLYNTLSDVWTNSTGNIPDPRTGHTALLSSDQQLIIVYGGIMTNSSNGGIISAEPQLTVLSITNFTWIDQVVLGVDYIPVGGLAYHTANMVENYMFVAFVASVVGGLALLGIIAAISGILFNRKKRKVGVTKGENIEHHLTRQSGENQEIIIERESVEHHFVIGESGEHKFHTGESGFTDKSGNEVHVQSTEESTNNPPSQSS